MLFERTHKANVLGVPLGTDFPKALVDGLLSAYEGRAPEELAKVHLIVNTTRMKRRVEALFDEGRALLLPRISLISDVGAFAAASSFPPAIPAIQRELQVAPLIHRLIDKTPDLAPRSAVYDLAASLVRLMSEMQEEGVAPTAISDLDVTDASGHWERAQEFFGIAQTFFENASHERDAAERARLVIASLTQGWAETPPDHPVIIAGSTGSRGLTQLLLRCVAQLPQGAVVLPGYDFDFAAGPWPELGEKDISEDHPQYRFHAFLRAVELGPSDVRVWPLSGAQSTARTQLVSLAMRPAPVTDQWITEGEMLAPLAGEAMQAVTLLEATNTREEALAIALRLRQAAETGTRAALITPDRTLARQVSAALGRWHITPDDSAGEPLHLTPVGRLLRHAAQIMQEALTAEMLITVLKHPRTHIGEGRGQHLLNTLSLEAYIRRKGVPHPDGETLRAWAEKADDPEKTAWANWVTATFMGKALSGELPLAECISRHVELTEQIAKDRATLWRGHKDGREAEALLEELRASAHASADMTLSDYANLLHRLMSAAMVREVDEPHTGILIWGTLEARVQGVDLLILAGLNEGSWPETLPPDPWLNRQMRHKAGLLLPERKVGLSAHDFQQAICAPEVWLTRAQKADDAETVPSRWLLRLVNLLSGLPDRAGAVALKDMRERAHGWLSRARQIDAPVGLPTPAARPAPCPPVSARPKQLSITDIQKLTRDPYAIYAKHVLGLRPLGPLQKLPDALLRGNVLHEVMERFVEQAEADPSKRTHAALMEIAEAVSEAEVPWPAARLMWLARFERIIDTFLEEEAKRLNGVTHSVLEREARFDLGAPEFALIGKADRLDLRDDGTLAIYDYKTGKPPSPKERNSFDQQLPLTALLAEKGAFKELAALPVTQAAYIGLGSENGEKALGADELDSGETLTRLRKLISAYLAPDKGFASRRAMAKVTYAGDYDHLARYGEWSETDAAETEVLT